MRSMFLSLGLLAALLSTVAQAETQPTFQSVAFTSPVAQVPGQRIQSMSKRCGKCGRTVSNSARAGQRCPHCGAYWRSESKHNADSGGGASVGTIVVRTVLGLLVVAVIAALVFRNFDAIWEGVTGKVPNSRTEGGWQPVKDSTGRTLSDKEMTKDELQYKYGYIKGSDRYKQLHGDDEF